MWSRSRQKATRDNHRSTQVNARFDQLSAAATCNHADDNRVGTSNTSMSPLATAAASRAFSVAVDFIVAAFHLRGLVRHMAEARRV
jgi:hypothetical protein